jgi:hypothetical protein
MTYQSIPLGVNNEVINDDLESHIRPANTLPDNQRGNHHIQINTSGFARYQQHDGVATQGNATTQVQLLQDDGLVKVGGYEVKPEVAERLKGAAPQLFVSDDAKAIEAAKESDNAKDDEASARNSTAMRMSPWRPIINTWSARYPRRALSLLWCMLSAAKRPRPRFSATSQGTWVRPLAMLSPRSMQSTKASYGNSRTSQRPWD